MDDNGAHPEAGFTLVETLVALALASFVLAFSVSGLSTSLRISNSMNRMQQSATTDAVTQHLRSLISSAFPATFVSPQDGLARLLFDGQPQTLEFVTISSGYALEGGLVRVRLSLDCDQTGNASCRLTVGTAVHKSRHDEIGHGEKVAALSGLSAIHFRYFGRQRPDEQPAWFESWSGQDRLPAALAIRFTFVDQTVTEVNVLVQLRNA